MMRNCLLGLLIILFIPMVFGLGESCSQHSDCDTTPHQYSECDGDDKITTSSIEYCDLDAMAPICTANSTNTIETCAELCCDGDCVSAICSDDTECVDETGCSAGICENPNTCAAQCTFTEYTQCIAGISCPILANTCPDQICYVPSCTDGCGLIPIDEFAHDTDCQAPQYCDGSGECITPPICEENILLSSACNCGGEIMSSSYCCDASSSTIACDANDCVDSDNDGYYQAKEGCGEADCDDSSSSIHPGAVDICENSIDENCDGADSLCDCGDISAGECLDEQVCENGVFIYKCSICECREGRTCDRSLEVCVLGSITPLDDSNDSFTFGPKTGCTPSWSCDDWTACSSSRIQRRICSDANACGTDKDKPSETKFCTPSADTSVIIEPDVPNKSLSDVLKKNKPKDFKGLLNKTTQNINSSSDLSSEEVDSAFDWRYLLLGVLVLVLIIVGGSFLLKKKKPKKKTISKREMQARSIHSLAAKIHVLREQGKLDGEIDALLEAQGWLPDIIKVAKEQLNESLQTRASKERANSPVFNPTRGERAREELSLVKGDEQTDSAAPSPTEDKNPPRDDTPIPPPQ